MPDALLKVGDKFYRTLPAWIDKGRTVVVTVTEVLKKWGVESFNGHDFDGTWVHSDGSTHRGKFYLKNLTSAQLSNEQEVM